ncbi:selenide, water dikinase SelD [Enterococcus rivorum]|uniref:Selenide, water dikinase n=1 Tax=Enterococcus rivorum TaxID=762845 RepID=A0A1E5KVZ4_9ENTE|nr:selenide, water dikinase SelD [Enterococcus rivorum]MBP2100298.1 selenide,water dikinase [Enterococcus rivorum]OEH82021.1 selenide, water dikinase SelD [Enterococcus rivorum]
MVEENRSLFICGGCNSKIGPELLQGMLEDLPKSNHKDLLVGFDQSDDAAVIKISEDLALIQTLDFFPAIVSDPYLFGQIAATNALSDVYAMGGEVTSALNIVCFPEEGDINSLKEILSGGAEKVLEAGGILAGGHSIHDAKAKYGLSVTGKIHPKAILLNTGCQLNDLLILTKPLGVGMITTAYSVGEISEATFKEAVTNMTTLNKYAAEIAKNFPVHSCTDITGFGLLGHLSEMLGEAFSATLYSEEIPIIEGALDCAKAFLTTAGGQRNRNYLKEKVAFKINDFALEEVLFDPQTSGGLLYSIAEEHADAFLNALNKLEISSAKIGKVIPKENSQITVR